jgi:hypothetical protein
MEINPSWTCNYPENLKFSEKVTKYPLPQFVKVKLSAENNQINCLIFSFQPPMEYPQGNEVYPVPINLDEKAFEMECREIYKVYKEKSKQLCEKLERKKL